MEILWGHKTPKETIMLLKSSYAGLSEDEVKERVKKHGLNIIKTKNSNNLLNQILNNITNPVSLILLTAAFFLFAVDEHIDGYIIIFTFFVNLIISLVQEGKASNAFKKLHKTEKRRTIVRRHGEEYGIDIKDLVPGDIVILKTGMKVPADIRILSENDLSVDESILTGEWAPVAKHAHTIVSEIEVAEKLNMLWGGTLISGGRAEGIVVKTGQKTKLGDFSKYLSLESIETPLQKAVKKIALFILLLVGVSLVGILVLGFFAGIPFVELVFIGAAISIAAIPNGLPATVTVVLAVGMSSVLKKGGLIRNLLAAETLGATTWILTDKTGTLTEGNMKLSSIVTGYNKTISILEKSSTELERVLEATLLCSDSTNISEDGEVKFDGNPIDRAVSRAGIDLDIKRQNLEALTPRVAYLPFSSKRGFSASINNTEDGLTLYSTGSPEKILKFSNKYINANGEVVELDTDSRLKIKESFKNEAKAGKRIIAAGFKQTDRDSFLEERMGETPEDEVKGLTFLALLVFEDPVRASVNESIEFIKNANVDVNIVTGDNANTALYIAKETGIYKDKAQVITGKDFNSLEDKQILEAARAGAVFARMAPENKLRLLIILQKDGEVVAMTGDGVNDAPTLQHAAIGIAVGSGTEVAKEASDLILLKNNFSTITDAIIEGRKIITNIRKIVIYLLSTSFSEVILVVGAILFGLPVPLLPAQILWANLIEEGFMSFGFAFEKDDPNARYKDPHNPKHRKIIVPEIHRAVLLLSFATGIFLLILYFFLTYRVDAHIDEIRTMLFIALSIDSAFFAISLKRLDTSIYKINIFDNKYLLGAITISLSLLVVAFFNPFLTEILHLASLPAKWIVLLIITSAVYHLFVIETVKYVALKDLGGTEKTA